MALDDRKARGILDSKEKVRKVDKHGMLDLIGALPDEMALLMKGPMPKAQAFKGITNIVFSGMGGSGIVGDIIRSWLGPRARIPILVNRGYDVPPFAGPGTLFVAISFSGNTAETLSAFERAREMGCTVVALSSGGQLEAKARDAGAPFYAVKAPEGTAPRAAMGHMLVPLALVLEGAGLVKARDELDEAVHVLRSLRARIGPEALSRANESKRVAIAVHGLIPVVQGYGLLEVAARRWKTQFNENAKVLAWADFLPEMNHNSLVGWNGDKAGRGHASIILRDERSEEDDPRMSERVEATKELAWSNSAKVLEVMTEGKGPLARILSIIYKGDYASVFLAVLRGVDPLPVAIIDVLKDQLGKGRWARRGAARK